MKVVSTDGDFSDSYLNHLCKANHKLFCSVNWRRTSKISKNSEFKSDIYTGGRLYNIISCHSYMSFSPIRLFLSVLRQIRILSCLKICFNDTSNFAYQSKQNVPNILLREYYMYSTRHVKYSTIQNIVWLCFPFLKW